jgi:hypothetical protein
MLIVYPTPDKNRDWEMLYQSNFCATPGDALFEIQYWGEDELNNVIERMKVGDVRRSDCHDEDEESEIEGNDKYEATSKGANIKKAEKKKEGGRKRAGEILQAQDSKRIREDVEMAG